MTRSIEDVYRAFKFGAQLSSEEVERLFRSRGHVFTNNQLREFRRDSDRGGRMSVDELYDLVSAWADEQRKP